MADTKTESAPAPKPSITERANADLAAAKTGHDPLKPLRYAIAFTGGTLTGALDGMTEWGRKGMKYGGALGIVVGIAAPWLIGGALGVAGVLFTAGTIAVSSFALGMVSGAAHGLATGGSRAVGRIHRAEKYAEDLIVRDKQQRTARPNRADYRPSAAARKAAEFEEHRQFMERQAEIRRDTGTHSSTWADRINEGRSYQQDLGR